MLQAAVVAKREAERAARSDADDAAIEARARAREARDAEKYGLAPGGRRPAAGAGAGAGSDAALLSGDAAAAARVAEEDAMLSQISRNLGGLKNIGTAINDELVRQDPMIEELGQSMDRVTGKIDANKAAADKLARS